MICLVCHKTIKKCSCQDIDKKLKKIAFTPGNLIAIKWCCFCDKHYARCKCEKPDFFIVRGGEEIDVSYGLENLEGEIIKPDLKRR